MQLSKIALQFLVDIINSCCSALISRVNIQLSYLITTFLRSGSAPTFNGIIPLEIIFCVRFTQAWRPNHHVERLRIIAAMKLLVHRKVFAMPVEYPVPNQSNNLWFCPQLVVGLR